MTNVHLVLIWLPILVVIGLIWAAVAATARFLREHRRPTKGD